MVNQLVHAEDGSGVLHHLRRYLCEVPGQDAMLGGFPALRLAAQRSEQKPGVKKVKLPEKASEAMRQVLRSLRVGLSAVSNRMSLGGMVFAWHDY
jgi:hypothetical protein